MQKCQPSGCQHLLIWVMDVSLGMCVCVCVRACVRVCVCVCVCASLYVSQQCLHPNISGCGFVGYVCVCVYNNYVCHWSLAGLLHTETVLWNTVLPSWKHDAGQSASRTRKGKAAVVDEIERGRGRRGGHLTLTHLLGSHQKKAMVHYSLKGSRSILIIQWLADCVAVCVFMYVWHLQDKYLNLCVGVCACMCLYHCKRQFVYAFL